MEKIEQKRKKMLGMLYKVNRQKTKAISKKDKKKVKHWIIFPMKFGDKNA